jgi:Fe-S cluster assembly protein SufD
VSAAPASDRFAARFAPIAARAGAADAAWLAELRERGLSAVRDRGLPSTREEEWRYTNVAPLAAVEWTDPDPGAASPSRQEVESLAFPVFACSYFVFVNGVFREDLSSPRSLSGEVRAQGLARLRREAPEALRSRLGSLVDVKEHFFTALNTACLDDGAVVRIPAGATVASPIHLVFVSHPSGEAVASQPRVWIEAEPGSSAVLIQDHVSIGGGAAFTNAVTEVSVGDNARLELVLLQRESGATFHTSGLFVRVGRDGAFVSHTVTMGGRLVRNDLDVLLGEEGGECSLRGLFLGAGEQLIDNHTRVDHAVPHCTSRELYKGILGGRSHGVFRGRVIVRPDAQRTDATQSNPNLLLSDSAEIDTKPQLEIHANDVRCSHGSAIGQIDPEALFYLRSRGLDRAEARRVLTRGFAREITGELPSVALAERIEDLLVARLERPEDAP